MFLGVLVLAINVQPLRWTESSTPTPRKKIRDINGDSALWKQQPALQLLGGMAVAIWVGGRCICRRSPKRAGGIEISHPHIPPREISRSAQVLERACNEYRPVHALRSEPLSSNISACEQYHIDGERRRGNTARTARSPSFSLLPPLSQASNYPMLISGSLSQSQFPGVTKNEKSAFTHSCPSQARYLS